MAVECLGSILVFLAYGGVYYFSRGGALAAGMAATSLVLALLLPRGHETVLAPLMPTGRVAGGAVCAYIRGNHD